MKKNQDTVNIELLKSLEPEIRQLLWHPDMWKTLDVDYYPPRVERLYTEYDGYRIHLHFIHPTKERCLFHKHKWPAVFKQLVGSYEMGITYSDKEVSSDDAHTLPSVARFVISAGSYYEMTQTDCLHYVKPMDGASASIMVTKDLYPEAELRREVLDRKLEQLPDERKRMLLEYFKRAMIDDENNRS